MICGGIDLGGTKIEARLFDGPEARTVDLRRLPTPRGDFDTMMAAVSAQVDWLCERAADPALPVGVAVPGVIDPATGVVFAANLPAGARAMSAVLHGRHGRPIPVVNDAMAFACSEARGGAGTGCRSVMGLVLGTGLGGGLALDGALPHRHAGLAVEVGHVGMPARALARHGLPLWPCGCGKEGCIETYVSGRGLARLALWRTGTEMEAPALAASEDPGHGQVLDAWADLAGECLLAIQLLLDPDCIVLGGGLSKLPGVTERLSGALARLRLGEARAPSIRLARHGDSSGARGAALLAVQP